MRWTLEPALPFARHAHRWQRLNARNGDTPLLDPAFVEPLLTEWCVRERMGTRHSSTPSL